VHGLAGHLRRVNRYFAIIQPGRQGTPRADGCAGLGGYTRAPCHALSPRDLREACDGNRA
jgi:hypothetical protein